MPKISWPKGYKPHWTSPVVGGQQTQSGLQLKAEISGTAFPLGRHLFLTANHVAEHALSLGQIRLVRPHPDGKMRGYPATVVARWPDVDLAALETPGFSAPALSWRAGAGAVRMYDPVRATGFPFALNFETGTFTVRAAVGLVSATLRFDQLPGRPWVYELTCQAPRGMSGAALQRPSRTVIGCVIGNTRSFMTVFSNRETTEAVVTRVGDVTTITKETFEQVEGMHQAVAITSGVILALTLPSGRTVRDHILASGGSVTSSPGFT